MHVLHKINNPEMHHPGENADSSPDRSGQEKGHSEEGKSGTLMTEKSIQDEVNRLVALKLESITESLMAKVEIQLLVLLKKATANK